MTRRDAQEEHCPGGSDLARPREKDGSRLRKARLSLLTLSSASGQSSKASSPNDFTMILEVRRFTIIFEVRLSPNGKPSRVPRLSPFLNQDMQC